MKPRNRLTLSHENLRAELNEIVERYPAHFGDDRGTLTREETVKRIRKLGFTEGDALRWLGFETTRWGAAFASGRCMIRLRLAHFIHYWADRLEGGETYRERVRRRLGIAA
jgi:hypothetical protein